MNRRTEEEKRGLITEWERSGEAAAAFCKRRGISRSTLHRWNRDEVNQGKDEISFVPVVLDVREEQRKRQCRIHVGNLFIIECGEDTSPLAVELALRGAVAACSPISAR